MSVFLQIYFHFLDIFPDISRGLNFADGKVCDILRGLYFAAIAKILANRAKINLLKEFTSKVSLISKFIFSF